MPGPTQDAEEKPIPHPDPEAPDPVEVLSSVLGILAANSVYSWVWVIPENRVLFSHPSLASLFAVDPEEAAAGLPIETFFEAIHEEDRERVTVAFENAVASGEECSADYRVLGADGRLRWVAMRGRAEYDGEVAPLRFPVVLIDITERKQAEERLALQNAVTRLLVEPRPLEDVIPEVLRSMGQGLQGSFGAYWRVDEAAGELRCEWVWRDSERLAEDLERVSRGTRFEPGVGLPGRVWQTGEPEWVADLRSDRNVPRMPVAAADGLGSALAFPVCVGAEVVGVMESFSRRIRTPDPELLRTVDALGDLVGQYVERRRTEAGRRLSERRFRRLVEQAADAVFVHDLNGNFLEVNEQACESLGYTREELLEMRVQDVEKNITPGNFVEIWEQGVEGSPVTVEGRHRRKDGSEFPVEVRVGALEGEEDTLILALARDITERKRIERERELLLHREQEISQTLQRSLLPPSLPEIPGAELAARYVAAGEGMEVGGDFYDAFPIPRDRWGLVVGDVTGKGPEAAALTSLAHYTIRAAAARQGEDPEMVLSTLNEEIMRQIGGERQFSIVYGELKPMPGGWALSMATGGHPPPFVLHPTGRVEALEPGGMILGVDHELQLGGWRVALSPGDTVVFYTDGATEARDEAGEFFGEERLRQLCESYAGLTAAELATKIEAAVVDFQRGDPRDDVALLVLRVAPDANPV